MGCTSVDAVPIAPQIVDEITRRLRSAAPDAELVLFGSHARGDADANSDIDILVIRPVVENAAAEAVGLRRRLRGLGVPIDIVVMDRGTVEEWRDVVGAFAHNALAEGRVLAA